MGLGVAYPPAVVETRTGGPRWALRARAGIAMGLTSLALAASLATFAYSLVRSSLVDEREDAATRQAYANARVLRGALRTGEADVADAIASLQVGPDGGAVLVTAEGTFTSSVDVGVDDLPGGLTAGVADGRAGRQRTTEDRGPRLTVGVPIVADGAQYYELSSLAEVDRALDVLASSLAVGGAAATAVGAAVGVAVSGAVLRPLRRAAAAARRIVGGDLDTRLDAERDRDLAPLADAFNDMVDDLRDRLDREARFASDVTHELRGPLTVLASAVNVVERRRDQLPAEAAEAIDALDAQVSAFNRLVLDLLEISRFEVGTARPDLREVDVEQFLRASLAERPAPPPLRVALGTATSQSLDPRRIHQVLANLLDNAANYAGGATAVVAQRADDGALRIAVEDAGPGIAEDEREAVFGRFARGTTGTSDGAPRGSGLGLALCADHVRLHGGRIWVEGADTGGARFVVELPAGAA